MKRSAVPNEALPATKRTRRRSKSTPEKRQSAAQRVRRHPSNAAGTAQADIVRENHRLRMQRARASQENTLPPSQQESMLSGEAMTAMPSLQRRPMTAVPTAASVQHQPPPFAAMRTPVSCPLDALPPAAMTDSRAMPPTAPRRTTARVVPPSTAIDAASAARYPSEANPTACYWRRSSTHVPIGRAECTLPQGHWRRMKGAAPVGKLAPIC
jgi:hypothetical protein